MISSEKLSWIKEIARGSGHTYGSRRMAKGLQALGYPVTDSYLPGRLLIHVPDANPRTDQSLTVGTNHTETIRASALAEILALDAAGRGITNLDGLRFAINVETLNLAGNPLHEEQLEIVDMLGDGVLALNTVIDEQRNLVYASFGDVVTSHEAAVAFVRDSIEIKVMRVRREIALIRGVSSPVASETTVPSQSGRCVQRKNSGIPKRRTGEILRGCRTPPPADAISCASL